MNFWIKSKLFFLITTLRILHRWRRLLYPLNFRQGWKNPAAVDAQTSKLRDCYLGAVIINIFAPEQPVFAGLNFYQSSSQFFSFRFGIFSKWRMFPVAIVKPLLIDIAAINRSKSWVGLPIAPQFCFQLAKHFC